MLPFRTELVPEQGAFNSFKQTGVGSGGAQSSPPGGGDPAGESLPLVHKPKTGLKIRTPPPPQKFSGFRGGISGGNRESDSSFPEPGASAPPTAFTP